MGHLKAFNTLLVASPRGAQCKDDEGRLPLHYACLKSAPEGVIKALLASYPKACLSKDDDGRLPIHHACSKGAPEAVIETLLKTSSKGAQSKDDQGRLPIHHACRKNASEKVIKTMLRVYPRSAQVKDDQDKLPIHYACQNSTSASLINVLLMAYPESVYAKNGFGYTPLAEAKAIENPKMANVIETLEAFQAEQDKLKESEDPSSGTSAGLQSKVNALTERVDSLEQMLSKVAAIGELLKGKSDDKAIVLLAEQLSSLSPISEGSENTPQMANV